MKVSLFGFLFPMFNPEFSRDTRYVVVATGRMNFWLHLNFSTKKLYYGFNLHIISDYSLIIFFYKIRLFCTWVGLSHELCKIIKFIYAESF